MMFTPPHTRSLCALVALLISLVSVSGGTIKMNRHYTDKSALVKRALGDQPSAGPSDHSPVGVDLNARVVEYSYDRTIQKRGQIPRRDMIRHAKRADSKVALDIDTSGGIAYTAQVLVGAGKVAVPVLVDTGSADLWVAASDCSKCSEAGMTDSGVMGTPGCKAHEKGYGSGSVHGCIVPTDITIGEYSLPQYGLMTVQESEGFDGKFMSGILGLAGSSLAVVEGQKTPMDLMVSGGMVSSPEVGFYLARDGDGSELVFGDVHSSPHADQNKKVTLQRTDDGALYRVSLDAFIAHGRQIEDAENKVAMQGIEVIIDTGTSDIRVPEEMMMPIYASLGKGLFYRDPANKDNFVVPCDGFEKPDETLGLQFGGQTFYVNWEDLISGTSSTDPAFCNLRIQPTPVENFLIVGNNFLRNTYHVVNVESGQVTFYGLKE